MKKTLLVCGMVCASFAAFATGPVNLNTFDQNTFNGVPLYLNTVGNIVDPSLTFVQYFVNGSPLSFTKGSTTASIWNLNDGNAQFYAPLGEFDFGAVHTGVADATSASFSFQAWQGASFANATARVQVDWTQATGTSAVTTPAPLPENPATLTYGGATSLVLTAVPEPSTVALGIMGGIALLARRRRQ